MLITVHCNFNKEMFFVLCPYIKTSWRGVPPPLCLQVVLGQDLRKLGFSSRKSMNILPDLVYSPLQLQASLILVKYSLKSRPTWSKEKKKSVFFLFHFQLRIEACDDGQPNKCTEIDAVIQVEQNLHSPVFDPPSYSNRIPETTAYGTVVATVKANDTDKYVSCNACFSFPNTL